MEKLPRRSWRWYQQPIIKYALLVVEEQAQHTGYSSDVIIRNTKPTNYTGSQASFTLANNSKKQNLYF